jgi:putative hydrolase of the HAD superfamily
VLFDAGETLVHPSPSFPELFAAVLLREGHVRDPDEVVAASSTVYERFSEAARQVELWTTSAERSRVFWHDVYERMLRALDLPSGDGLRDVLYREFTDLANYAMFDDVVPALDALERTGTTIGIVSNFEMWLEELLERLGVRERFSVRVISGVEGVEKPDPAIYRLALDRAGVDAADAAFVGDNPEFDVAPAAALGMTPVLIDRRGRHPDAAGLRVTDLRELVPALEAA